jgi:alpha-L-rhamnosidase
MMNMITIANLTSEYRKNPIGLFTAKPFLSWLLEGAEEGIFQKEYRIQVAETEEDLLDGKNLIIDSQWIVSTASTLVPYPGKEVLPGARVYWRVKVKTVKGGESEYSEPAFFETSLNRLSADWISSPLVPVVNSLRPVPLFRKIYRITKPVKQARLYATARGVYIPHINGNRMDRTLFNPGCTNYNKRILFETFDITNELHEGDNCFGAELSTGWYAGYYGYEGNCNNFGNKLAYCAEIHLQFCDGTQTVLKTDSSWKTSLGPIKFSEIYLGETYDARKEIPGWDKPDFEDEDWVFAAKEDCSHSVLYPHEGYPVIRAGELPALKIITTPSGDTVFDMGQNFVGWVKVRLQGKAGSRFCCDFAEVLDKNGEFYTENLRIEGIKDTYILKGEGQEVFEPSFTFHGFRYVRILEKPSDIGLSDIIGVVIHSEMPSTGEFSCDNPDLNQLYHNIIWGQKGNFLDIPTDCPQRDERLGWTGDAQVFIKTAAYNFDVAPFFRKWLRDVASEQDDQGQIPVVIPNVLRGMNHPPYGAAGWGDAAIICPWNLYLTYGDIAELQEFYPMMQAWNAFVKSRCTGYLWKNDFQFGDWLALDQPADSPSCFGGTDKDQVATCFFAYSTSLMVKAAKVLKREDDAKRYQQLYENIANAFFCEYVSPLARIGSNTQTSYILALMFDLLPEEYCQGALNRLVGDIEGRDFHISSGFLGISYLLPVLARFGRQDVAYKLLLQDSFPSWLYPIRQKATTIWERWDGIKPDGEFQTPGMNSFNHYAYGSVGAWMYENILGFTGNPGFSQVFFVFPEYCPLGSAEGGFASIHGKITSAWKKDKNRAVWNISIPGNVSATLTGATRDYKVVSVSGVHKNKAETILLGSGTYQILLEKI